MKSGKISNSGSHVWPAIRLGAAAEIAALVAELGQMQWLDAAEIEARQMLQFRNLFRFASEHSPFFHERAVASGCNAEEFQSVATLQGLPLLSRADIQSAGEGLFCRNVPEDQGRIVKTETSGSTGEPVHVRKTSVSQLFLQAYTLRNHDWHGVPYDARYSIIRPTVESYDEQPTWGPPFTLLYRTGRTQHIPMSTSLSEQIRHLREFQPQILLAYPSNLRGLVEAWHAHGMELTDLRFIRTIGETLPEDLRDRIAELDQAISVINGYSSQECGCIALQCPDGDGYHVMGESLIVEVVDQDDNPCPPGGIGRIVVTDLHNLATPLVRYEIGDYAQVGEPCGCGRGLKNLEKILGRRRNLVVKPNGDRHWPLVGFQRFDKIAPIRQYQLIQETVERITVRFVTDEPLTAEQKAEFTSLIQGALTYPFELDIRDQREKLPPQPGGKFEEFMSRVS